jgi:hypothetical protein
MPCETAVVANHRRRLFRWRYGLRAFLYVVTSVCLLLGAFCWHMQTQARRVNSLMALGFHVVLAEPTGFLGQIKMAMAPFFGQEATYDVTEVWNSSLGPLGTIVRAVAGQPTPAAVQDADLRQLANFPRLEKLSLAHTQVTDDGIKYLRELPALTTLYLNETAISDRGVTELSQLRGLTYLGIVDTKLSHASVKALRSDLAGCKVEDNIVFNSRRIEIRDNAPTFGLPDKTLLAPTGTK